MKGLKWKQQKMKDSSSKEAFWYAENKENGFFYSTDVLSCFRLRVFIHWIVTKKAFDMFIMFVIVLSSIALASEDPVSEKSERNKFLGYADYGFTAIFTLECCLKVSWHIPSFRVKYLTFQMMYLCSFRWWIWDLCFILELSWGTFGTSWISLWSAVLSSLSTIQLRKFVMILYSEDRGEWGDFS